MTGIDRLGRVPRLPLGVPRRRSCRSRSGSAGTASTSSRRTRAAGARGRFEDLPFRHHRREGERDGAPGGRDGTRVMPRTTWATGPGISSCARSSTRGSEPAALAMIAGYATAARRREPRSDDVDARAYLRRQQSVRSLRLRSLEATGRRDRAA